jgi:hypothetical protein
MHPQAGQITGTHVGAGGPEAERAQAGIRMGKERRGRKRSSTGRSHLCEQIPRTHATLSVRIRRRGASKSEIDMVMKLTTAIVVKDMGARQAPRDLSHSLISLSNAYSSSTDKFSRRYLIQTRNNGAAPIARSIRRNIFILSSLSMKLLACLRVYPRCNPERMVYINKFFATLMHTYIHESNLACMHVFRRAGF